MAFHPLLHHVRNRLQLCVPRDNVLLERLFKGTELDDLRIDDVFVENGLDLVVSPDNEGIGLVGREVKVYAVPYLPHLLQHCLDVVLLGGLLADLHAGIDVLDQSHVQNLSKGEAFFMRIDLSTG